MRFPARALRREWSDVLAFTGWGTGIVGFGLPTNLPQHPRGEGLVSHTEFGKVTDFRRTHLALAKDAPEPRPIMKRGRIAPSLRAYGSIMGDNRRPL